MSEGIHIHRTNFRKFVLANPNYFDNVLGTGIPPVVQLVEDTSFEQLTCVSFNPDLATLEATVVIKQPFGYGGDLCLPGTHEYIRFFVDYGSGFQDAGVASIEVHDIPDANDCNGEDIFPLAYVCSLPYQPQTDFCGNPLLPNVHAILSWETVPPANSLDPSHRFRPVWGNELECHVQIKPRLLIFKDLVAETAIKVPPVFESAASVPIPVPDPGPLAVGELATLYGRGETVPAHRFGLAEIQALSGAGSEAVLAKIEEWKGLGLNWPQVVGALDEVDADTTYEQLECVGLDNGATRLVATFRIKQPTGYSGGLCTAGSTEYIAFWADWYDDCTFQYLSTATVKVHDMASIPAGGLCYAAVVPVNLDSIGQDCSHPRVGRIRAVLSWEVPPSTVDPEALNFWGNRIDAHVQIRPSTGDGTPRIGLIGNVPVPQIDTHPTLGTGLTIASAHFDGMVGAGLVDALGRMCPFGGLVIVGGLLLDPSSPYLGWTYQVQLSADGLTWPGGVTTAFTRTDNSFINHVVNPGFDGFFPFFSFQDNIGGTYAYWYTAGSALWYMRLALKDPLSNISFGPVMRVQLDNTAPVVDIHIDSGGDCKTFDTSTVLNGHFSAFDPSPSFFGSYRLRVLPDPLPGTVPPLPAPAVNPASGTVPTGSSPWTLNTAGMPPCGYVVVVDASDRSVVSSVPGSHNYSGEKAVGFCLTS